MRRLATPVLTLLLLAPMLVCAMPACPHQVQTTQLSGNTHCDEQPHENSKDPAANIMLLADCMGVDLEQSLYPPPIDAATPSFRQMAYVNIQFWTALRADISQAGYIRGPPTTTQPPPVLKAPLYLTTLRLRV